jgi:Icc protein
LPNPSTTPFAPLIVQITDPHLFADADGKLLGMVTRDSLEKVIDKVLLEQPQIDLLLVTGDLSQDGTVESYQAFQQMSARIKAPTHWFCGNHDEPLAMEEAAAGIQAAGGADVLKPVIDIGNWRITLLNSAVPGSVPGFLPESELKLLAQSLSEAPERHHLICLHHHPVSIQCKWMEPIGLRNPHALFEVLGRFPQTKALLWGHIHQEVDRMQGDLRLLATPSTCIQFKPLSDDFALDDLPPGYRWLRLQPDGSIDTGVSRVEGYEFKPDFSSAGY